VNGIEALPANTSSNQTLTRKREQHRQTEGMRRKKRGKRREGAE
jgi:hypothetical protein